MLSQSNVFKDEEKIIILRELKERNLTQRQIAEKHNCSVSLLEKINSGKLWADFKQESFI
ncbi:hypothetical protein [Prochlorococcus sp. MIT 1306]|uniref:hypothetical protein n=1 Tax=Prochlorococcus sp. MIT 1306 TaxID=1799667 RepID=UPI000AEABD53|nr:hypothetical protein [Prochlorococcus sp. MIT 1306]